MEDQTWRRTLPARHSALRGIQAASSRSPVPTRNHLLPAGVNKVTGEAPLN